MTADRRHGEAMRRILAQHAGNPSDAGAVAENIIAVWCSMADRLSPVIGAKGVDVLFRRAMQVAGKAFPWLAVAEDYRSRVAQLESLKTRLKTQDGIVAAEAGDALLGTFINLLASMIGASLTERLLSPVWQSLPPKSDQETSP